MANTTAKGALSIHGTNPQFLVDKVVRSRIYDSQYWKESCFALTAESLIDEAIGLRYIGGTYANVRPTEFMCLVLKLLQLQPEKEIVLEYLRADEFKYLRALAAFYVRLTFTPLNVYQTLEPLLGDYKKLRLRNLNGSYSLICFDEFIDELLTKDIVCEIVLPRLTQRKVLEETEGLGKKKSLLALALGLGQDSEGEQAAEEASQATGSGSASTDDDQRFISRSPSPDRFISRSPTPEAEDSGAAFNSALLPPC